MIENTLFKKVHGCNAAGFVGAALGEPSRRCGGGVFDCFGGLCGPIEGAYWKVIDEVLGKPVDKMLPQTKAWTGGEAPEIGYEASKWKTEKWLATPHIYLRTIPSWTRSQSLSAFRKRRRRIDPSTLSIDRSWIDRLVQLSSASFSCLSRSELERLWFGL